MVRSLVDDTDFLIIVTGALKRDSLATYLFIDNVFPNSIYLMKENGFKLKKTQQTADDIPLKLFLMWTPEIIKCILQMNHFSLDRLDWAAKKICLYVNSGETEITCIS